ncbi:MAG: 50S ribosomal protein L18 [Candidatus Parcubacteria bacterium]|nr:MAG: 50S ribosomal protein L18 [Candidatus Parcubacteria bacterium]
MKISIHNQKIITKRAKRLIRHKRIRAKIKGTPDKPRVSVFRSNKNIYLQLIDDIKGHTIVSASTLELRNEKMTGKEKAKKVAEIFAEKLKDKNIQKVVFDRGGYKYHGRVKIIAETLREKGIVV